MSLRVVPCTQRQAKQFVHDHHRHNDPPPGGLFALAALDVDRLCGVVIVGRPVAKGLQDGLTAEITRCCSDGTRNVCSLLYGRARRAAFALGYRRVITYTLPEENGASLRAAGMEPHQTSLGGKGWGNRTTSSKSARRGGIRWESHA
jgi:hypothetical protein